MENSHNTPLLLQPILKKSFCSCLTHLWEISPQSIKNPYNSQSGVFAELFYIWILEHCSGRIREAGGGQRQWCSSAAFPVLSLPLLIQLWELISAEGHMNVGQGLLPLFSVLRLHRVLREGDRRTREPWEFTVISKAGWTELGKILLSQLLQFGSGWKFVSRIWEVKWLPWCHSEVTTQRFKFCVLRWTEIFRQTTSPVGTPTSREACFLGKEEKLYIFSCLSWAYVLQRF